MDERNDELFDDLFEPFELDEGPPPPRETPDEPEIDEADAPPPARTVTTIACPSCGTQNPANNRHCEACGARLSRDPLPVAPPPLGGASPGARALIVLGAVVLIAVVIALVINITGGDDATATTSTSSTTSTTAPTFTELEPTSVSASSELSDRFPPDNLLDNDPSTEWQDASLRGDGAELTFTFAQPVRITSIEVVNLPDQSRFKQNYRVRGYVIDVDDLAISINGELNDDNEPQRIPIGTVSTTTLTFEVRTTYPAEPVGDDPPFSELAIADIRFFGSLVEE